MTIDCANALNLQYKDDNDTWSLSTKVVEIAKILNCVVTDIEYEISCGNGYEWISPVFIVFEKDNYKMEIKKEKIKYKTSIQYKFNHKKNTIKEHTTKLSENELVLNDLWI